MTGVADPSASPPKETIVSLEDFITAFSVSDWFDAPPAYVSDLPETSPESNIRTMTELEYRKTTTPTKWFRYLTLGRYVMDGFTFDSCIEEMSSDPLKLHCIIWYQYQYHLDHKLVIPFQLLSGASRCSQPYLIRHAESAISLNTNKVTWQSFSRTLSLNNSWSEVSSKSKKKKDKRKLSRSSASSAVSSVGVPTNMLKKSQSTRIRRIPQLRPMGKCRPSCRSRTFLSVMAPIV